MSQPSAAESTTLFHQQALHDKCIHSTGIFAPFALADIDTSVPALFERTVRRCADRVAIQDKSRDLTYREFDEFANRIAHAILRRRGEDTESVGVLIEPSAVQLCAYLAALKAKKFYVPLTTHFPASRLAYMLRDSKSALLVTNNQNLPLAVEIADDRIPIVNIDHAEIAGLTDDNPSLSIPPDTPAYLLYTSGSTGQPKAVVGCHRNILVESLKVTNQFHICPDDRMALLRSTSFFGAVRKLYPALLVGASVHLADARVESPVEIAERLVREEVTVGSRVRGFDTREADGFFLPCLRLLTAGGQVIYRRDIESSWKYIPHDALQAVCYSSTEAGGITCFLIDRETPLSAGVVPAGYPAEGVELLLFDDQGNPVDEGDVGNIVVQSPYLSLGYWQRPDLTEAAFATHPDGNGRRLYRTGDIGRRLADGSLLHLGRVDAQLKIRGHRVELMETQAAMMEVGGVQQAVVTVAEDASGDRRLVAYFVAAGDRTPSATALRRELAAKLPDFMIPSKFVALDEFPLTATGKVDKRALPSPEGIRPHLDTLYAPPRTSVERTLVDQWKDVLGLDLVGVHDRFLDLGGDSLRAGMAIARIESEFRVRLPLSAIFEAPTVAKMAEVLKARLQQQESDTSSLASPESQ